MPRVTIESIVEFNVWNHMNNTLNVLLAFSLMIGFFFLSFTHSIQADSVSTNSHITENSKLMDQKSIDELLGPDPYLFDAGNHMDDFDSSTSNKNINDRSLSNKK